MPMDPRVSSGLILQLHPFAAVLIFGQLDKHRKYQAPKHMEITNVFLKSVKVHKGTILSIHLKIIQLPL